MSNNKQSSVEWLWDKFVNKPLKISDLVKLLEQARAMHKEEIIKSWMATDNELQRISAEQYYNQTFGGNNEQ